MTPRDPAYAAKVAEVFARQGALRAIGAELLTVEPGRCRIRLPNIPAVQQHHGFVHGGMVGTLADTAGGFAAHTMTAAGTDILTVEYKINFTAPARGEAIVATGRVLRAGRTLIVCTVDVEAIEAGQPTPCATALQTIMVLPGAPR